MLTDTEGRVLLVRHTYTDGWYLPGGGVDRRESPEEALRRELAEELRITDPPPLVRFGEYLNTREYKRDTIVIFTVGGFAGGLSPNREIAAAEFFHPRSLPPGLSPGTRRRIDEWLGLARIDGRW